MTYEELNVKIMEWAHERRIDEADPRVEFMKMAEELGELSSAYNKQKRAKLVDSKFPAVMARRRRPVCLLKRVTSMTKTEKPRRQLTRRESLTFGALLLPLNVFFKFYYADQERHDTKKRGSDN